MLEHVLLEVGVVGHLLLNPVRLEAVEDHVVGAVLQVVQAGLEVLALALVARSND